MHTFRHHTHRQSSRMLMQRFMGKLRRQQAGRREDENKGKNESTSILRPSTIVPFSFSRARSASVLVSKVTNPKP